MTRREAFQAAVSAQLQGMGWKPQSWRFIGARLVMSIAGEIRDIPIRTNMSHVKLARELGKLEGLAEALGLRGAQAA
jgi:hypothetical protein